MQRGNRRSQGSSLGSERRKEERVAADYEASFQLEGVTFQGVVVDVSPSGFRLRHSARLRSGTELAVALPCGTVSARVVWTRETPGVVESGFLLAEGSSTLNALLRPGV